MYGKTMTMTIYFKTPRSTEALTPGKRPLTRCHNHVFKTGYTRVMAGQVYWGSQTGYTSNRGARFVPQCGPRIVSDQYMFINDCRCVNHPTQMHVWKWDFKRLPALSLTSMPGLCTLVYPPIHYSSIPGFKHVTVTPGKRPLTRCHFHLD